MRIPVWAGLAGVAVCWAAVTQYKIETFAVTDFTGDGRSAASALLIQPQSVALDPLGNVYVSDAGDHRIRRIGKNGIIETLTGNGLPGYRGDSGPAALAQWNAPYGIAADSTGNLFVADLGNAVVRKITADGRVYTIAGGGDTVPDARTAIPATRAKMMQPRDVAVDRNGSIFISDFGAHRVYEVSPGGVLSVVAGTGEAGAPRELVRAVDAPLSHPAGLALDASRNLYICDSGNRRVRKVSAGVITTLADKAGKALEFTTPTGIAVDPLGRLYIADGGTRLATVTPAGELGSQPIGGTSVAVSPVFELLVVADRQVRRLVGLTVEVVAGTKNAAAAGDGRPKSEWRFSAPTAVLADPGGNVFIADTGNGRVRRIGVSGELSTLTSEIQSPAALAFDSQYRLHVADRATGAIYRISSSGRADVYARGPDNRPFKPSAIAFNQAGDLYIADTGNNLIRKYSASGQLTLVAGGGTEVGDGPALLARLGSPAGLAFDSRGDLWFTEASTGRVRRLNASGQIETLSGTELREPRGLRIDSADNLLIADAALHRVVLVAGAAAWRPLAGSGDRGFAGDGDNSLAAMLNTPFDVALEPGGSILICDSGNNRIRRLTAIAQVAPVEPPVGPPPGSLTLPVFSVQHLATLDKYIAPGQLAYISGPDLNTSALTVSFGGFKAAVLAAVPNRLTVRVPPELRAGMTEVTIHSGDTLIAKSLIELLETAPGILTVSGGSGQALAQNEDGWPNSIDNPAGRGSIMTFYLTGEGSGAVSMAVDIGGFSCEVAWMGRPAHLPGLFQVNVRTPSGYAPSGVRDVVFWINGARTQPGATIVSR